MADIAELGVKVTTEGASESAKQLDNLAASAEQAQRKTEELSKSGEKTSAGLKSTSGAANLLSEAFSKVTTDSTALGAALGGAAGAGLAEFVGNVTGAILRWVGAMITAGDQLKELVDKTDLSARELQKWAYIGQQVGVNSNALVMAVQMLQQRLGDLSDGTGVAGNALKRLGIDQAQLAAVGGDTNKMLELLHGRMQGIADPTERASILFQLFGRSARELGPLFKTSAEDIERMSMEFDKLGVAMSDRLVNASDRFTDSMTSLFAALRGMLYPALEALLEPLSKFVEWMKDAVAQSGAMREAAFLLAQAVHLLSVPFRALGVVLIGIATSFEMALISLRAGATVLIALANRDIPSAKDALKQAGDEMVAVARRNQQAMADMIGLTDETAESTKRVTAEQQELSRAYSLVGKYVQNATGVTATFEAELRALQLVSKDAGWSQEQYVEQVESLIAKQPSAIRLMSEWKETKRLSAAASREATAALKAYLQEQDKLAKYAEQQIARSKRIADAEAKAIAAMENARSKELQQVASGTTAINKKAEAIQFEIDKLQGRTDKYETFETVQLKAEAQNYRETASIIAMFDPTSDLIEAYRKRADSIDVLIGKQKELGMAAEDAEAARAAATAWASAASQIEQALTDALVRGFESGRSVVKSVGDWIVNYFKTVIARGIAQSLMAAMASGLSAGANASGGGSSMGSSLLSGVSSLFSGGGGGSSLGGMGSMGGLAAGFGTAFGEGAMATVGGWFGAGAGTSSAFGAAGALSSMGGAGGAAASAGMALGAVAPYLAIAYGLYRVISGVGTGRMRGPAWQQWSSQTAGGGAYNPYSSVTSNPALGGAGYFNPQMASIIGAVAAGAASFGGAANANTSYGMYVSQGTEGSGALADARVMGSSGRALFGYSNNGSNADVYQRLMSAVPGMVLAGLQDSQLPVRIKEYFNTVSANGITEDQLNSMLETASAAHSMAESFKQLGGPFAQIQNLSVDARMALADLAGGLEQFAQKVAGYYSNFYSSEEQQAMALLSAQRTLESAGIDTTGLRDRAGFRSAVEGLDLSTEEGQKQFAAYMNAAGAFASGSDLLGLTGMSLAELTAGAPDYSVPLSSMAESQATTNSVLAQGFSNMTTVLTAIVEAIQTQKIQVDVRTNEPANVEVGWGGGN